MELNTLPRIKRRPPKSDLDKWMRDNGVTRTALAEAVGVDKGTISRIATGQYEPSRLMRDAILRATGLKKL